MNFCVGVLAKRLDIFESAVSQLLKILRKAGLVVGSKEGYYVHYTVEKDRKFIINLDNKIN